MKLISSLLVMLLVCAVTNLVAQGKNNSKPGKVSAEDFILPASSIIDSNTSAVIIADIGNTTFKGNDKGWVSYIFKRKTRIKILNKKAFELATLKIPLYTDGDNREKLENFSAVTYNLENGNVIASKMEKNDLFTDKIDKNHIEQKFTMPGVKENCIIEYSYTVLSDFYFNIPEWNFQNIDYPCLWSEYEVNIPSLVGYVFSRTGVHPFFIDKADDGHENYLIKVFGGAMRSTADDMMSINASTVKHRWVMKDLPAFYVENYLTSPENYIDKIDFQLSQTYDGSDVHPVKNTWTKVTEDLLKEEDFAAFITDEEHNGWLDKQLGTIVKSSTDQLLQAKEIYYYLSDNFTCTNYHNKYIKTNLQDVYKNKKGNVGEINLLLTDMLLRKQIAASPVVLSTREFGYNYASYPVLGRLDYVICKAVINDRVYFLDASRPNLGFGHLPANCYNGHARVISRTDSASVYFMPDSIKEQKITIVNIVNDEKDKRVLSGIFRSQLGYIESYSLRETIAKTGEVKYFEDIKNAARGDAEITEARVDSLRQPENPVTVLGTFILKTGDNTDIIYFNPLLWAGYKINPFAAATRKYPVEMVYPMNEIYLLNIEVPEGFAVDELPKMAKVVYNGGEGFFEYLIQKTETTIQMRCSLKLTKANFDPEDYNTLRDFFSYIVKKQSEQIVFKRKK